MRVAKWEGVELSQREKGRSEQDMKGRGCCRGSLKVSCYSRGAS